MAALGPFERAPQIAVALSGGADSLALALLLKRWAARRRGTVLALTVDHGVRPEAAAEARQVAGWMRRSGLRHATIALDSAVPGWRDASGGLQAAARAARYRVLADRCRDQGLLHLVTAHHADDQAETFLDRLTRGSGVTGLAAMPALSVRDGVRLLRPLLAISRERLEATLKAAGQAHWIDDPSNRDPRFLRTRLRQARPLLAAEGLDDAQIGKTVRRMGRARSALDAAAAALLAETVTLYPQGHARLDAAALLRAPDEVALRAVARLAQAVGGGAYPPREAALVRLHTALADQGGSGRTLGGCRFVCRSDGPALVCREAAVTEADRRLAADGTVHWDGRFQITVSGVDKPLSVGALGRRDPVAARRVLAPWPAAVRAGWPVILSRGRVVAVPFAGWRSNAAPPPNALRLRFTPRVPLAAPGFTVV